MTKFPRRTALALLSGGALSACVPSPVVVTRAAGDPFEGGIGGTGIVGVLNDFGSLKINGLRVELTSATRYVGAFGPVASGAVAPGMSLTVLADRSRDRLVARAVRIDHPVIGPVTRTARGPIRVNGVPVRAEPGAIGTLTPGTRVAVSGIWTPRGIAASRIDPAGDLADGVAGVVERGGATGLTVGGTPVRLPGIAPASGTFLAVRGTFDGTAIQADQTRPGRFGAATSPLRLLSVEGYLEPVAQAPAFRIAGLGHSFARDLRLAPLAADRAIFFGPYTGTFAASSAYVLPESFAARRSLLRDGLPDQAISTR
ncbi:DUF5666 domain-containing protein [Jannaschia pohangensis]|uniref:DUF5666 domain-containing protein n=1 Tax=Jannaschia pohangensis TaxID=390807 RepID=A0A1I3R1A3_9RHOB|nr:DUF5666 domain-containing protein [Jannaschia pohangensis]SFJ39499.1 hypothetical protein SAMN04488095_2732 [Jannaschia pohangensis]